MKASGPTVSSVFAIGYSKKSELDLEVYDSLHCAVFDFGELVFLRRPFVNGITGSEQLIRSKEGSQVFGTKGWIAM